VNPNPAPRAPVLAEPLEPRTLFSSSSIFFLSFSPGQFDPDPFALPAQNLALPQPAISLPHENLALPEQSLTLPTPASATSINLLGFYAGRASITGLGSTPLALSITRQHKGTISGTLTLPAFGKTISATVPVTFAASRHFSATLIQNGDSATLTARLNRDGTLTGSFSATTQNQHFEGTFSLARIHA